MKISHNNNSSGNGELYLIVNKTSIISVKDYRIADQRTDRDVKSRGLIVPKMLEKSAFEEWRSLPFVSEIEDGAGRLWTIDNKETLLDLETLFDGCALLLVDQILRPGSTSRCWRRGQYWGDAATDQSADRREHARSRPDHHHAVGQDNPPRRTEAPPRSAWSDQARCPPDYAPASAESPAAAAAAAAATPARTLGDATTSSTVRRVRR